MSRTTKIYMAKTNGLSVKGLGLSLGIITALGILVLGITSMVWGWGTELVDFTGNLYIGYDASVKGIIAGIIWGFVDGFVGGALLAWVYNKVS